MPVEDHQHPDDAAFAQREFLLARGAAEQPGEEAGARFLFLVLWKKVDGEKLLFDLRLPEDAVEPVFSGAAWAGTVIRASAIAVRVRWLIFIAVYPY